ncbi:MAG: hypothetical protein OEM97_07525 [Acidimicrobiia bacterium]|nr:hypothetical protein [Acidimicrobiia bacterium]
MLVRPAFLHDNGIRLFVHRLKYAAASPIPEPLIAAMVSRVPVGTTALVPVPRSVLRRLRYGVDPALELARAVGRETGIPVIEVLAVPFLRPSQARRGRSGRRYPSLRAVRPLTPGAIVVDDVVTTGRTLRSASEALGSVTTAVTLTTSSWG